MTQQRITFSGPMIRANLREIAKPGTGKTQTRRAMVLPDEDQYIRPGMGGWTPTVIGGNGVRDKNGKEYPEMVAIWHQSTGACHATKFQVGQTLWVREAWRTFVSLDAVKPSDLFVPGKKGAGIWYDADGSGLAITKDGEKYYGKREHISPFGKARSPMFMPRWASRISIEITQVRVQRLQDISEEDAIAEGCFKGKASGRVFDNAASMHLGGYEWAFARDWYADLWETINGPGSWAANPWVAVYTYRPFLTVTVTDSRYMVELA